MNGIAEQAKPIRSARKRWAFRMSAMLLGLAPFLLLESGLRIGGWQPLIPIDDPFVGFQSLRPLFVADHQGQEMVIADDRLEYFQPASFDVDKDQAEYRIFCIGGSTVQGRPYAHPTSFTSWLELALRAADDSRQWRVINCGGVSYASYRLAPILDEVLRYEPDLIILYTGHNEFLEDRSYAIEKQMPRFLSKSYATLSRSKVVQLTNQWLRFGTEPKLAESNRATLATEVDALLDYRGGLESYHRDPQWRAGVCDHFEFNLRRMIQSAGLAGVPIMIVDPPANLRDCPPFKSEYANDLTSDQLDQIDQFTSGAIELYPSDRNRALAMLEQAVEIDPTHAGNQFRIATWYDATGQHSLAKQHFQSALEQDICPLRIIAPMHQIIHAVTTDTGTPCIEIRRAFEQISDQGIPGDDLFFDHVHPSFRGHQRVAIEIAETLIAAKIATPAPDWRSECNRRFDEHWKSLGPVYFERGKQRLEGLRIWAEGRSQKLK